MLQLPLGEPSQEPKARERLTAAVEKAHCSDAISQLAHRRDRKQLAVLSALRGVDKQEIRADDSSTNRIEGNTMSQQIAPEEHWESADFEATGSHDFAAPDYFADQLPRLARSVGRDAARSAIVARQVLPRAPAGCARPVWGPSRPAGGHCATWVARNWNCTVVGVAVVVHPVDQSRDIAAHATGAATADSELAPTRLPLAGHTP
ncbi:hypothetical protein F0Q45_00995 [Mycobacterium simiae]|uniref:Uncharacterized protein n=1 Tax=Mycobacterium simiae TaxID=1784 RepID=A0A5B1BUS2_MYCSI|nr:hypothetical protein [Mycobacterium simiae]KAA1252096.1 hypothetical protein F0Q45_00995 [Mycobacterium simiae]